MGPGRRKYTFGELYIPTKASKNNTEGISCNSRAS